MKNKYSIIVLILGVLSIIGEVRCVYKAITCNWKPVGKAEAVYTIAACTGFGAIVGWLDIKDD